MGLVRRYLVVIASAAVLGQVAPPIAWLLVPAALAQATPGGCLCGPHGHDPLCPMHGHDDGGHTSTPHHTGTGDRQASIGGCATPHGAALPWAPGTGDLPEPRLTTTGPTRGPERAPRRTRDLVEAHRAIDPPPPRS